MKLLGQEITVLPQTLWFDLVMNFRTKSELKLHVLPNSTIQNLGLQSSCLVWLLWFKSSIKEHFKQISMSQTLNPVLRFKFFELILGIMLVLLFLSLYFCLFSLPIYHKEENNLISANEGSCLASSLVPSTDSSVSKKFPTCVLNGTGGKYSFRENGMHLT